MPSSISIQKCPGIQHHLTELRRETAVLWEVNGEEYKIAEYLYKVSWNLTPGTFTFRARIHGTPIISSHVTIEVY